MSRSVNWIVILLALGAMIFLAQKNRQDDPPVETQVDAQSRTQNGLQNEDLNHNKRAPATVSSRNPSDETGGRSVLPTSASTVNSAGPNVNQVTTSPVDSTLDSKDSPESRQARATQIEELKGQLAQLENQAQEISQNLSSSQQRQALSEERRNLSFSLQSLNRQEEEVLRRAQDALSNQSSMYQNGYQELERRIQEQTQRLKQIQDDIESWKENNFNASEQQLRVAELNDLFAQQSQVLEDLRQGRTNLANSIVFGQQVLQDQREMALDQIQQERQALQSESSALSAEINQSRQQRFQDQSRLQKLQEQITQTRQALQKEEQGVSSREPTAVE